MALARQRARCRDQQSPRDDDGPILSLAYAAGTTISRLNKGLRRRKDKSIFGFAIDPGPGAGPAANRKATTTSPTDQQQQRVVPIVQDNKNALLLQLPGPPLSETGMATLQHALARGLEVVFQLEEGEILTEPVPARDRRRGILLFEATEGGAGVLGRLTSDASALSQVAREALELMHYDNIDGAMAEAAADALTEVPDARCVAGCYRCLLSYYNQPDHELIDRTEREVKTILLRLARGRVVATIPQTITKQMATGALPWPVGGCRPRWSAAHGRRNNLPLAWRTRLAAAAIGSVDEKCARRPRRSALLSRFFPKLPAMHRRRNSLTCWGKPHDRDVHAWRSRLRAWA